MSDIIFKSDTEKQRHQQVMKAIDLTAENNQLAFLTTKRVSKASGVSDGVLFRLFSSKEAMLGAWFDSRGARVRNLLNVAPAGKNSLHLLTQKLLNDSVSLSFLCCQPMDTPYLRQQLEYERTQFRYFLHTRIELMSHCTAPTLSTDALTDHLMQSLYRAWDPENPMRQHHKEQLMQQLPWNTEQQHETFPPQALIQRLALNDSGFVFDPESGRSFTANIVGLYILRFLQAHDDAEQLLAAILTDFEVSRVDAERDITEFSTQVRKFLA